MEQTKENQKQVILTTVEVAEELRTSETHVRNIIHRGHLKAYKEGRKGGFRILRVHLNEYIQDKLDKGFGEGEALSAI